MKAILLILASLCVITAQDYSCKFKVSNSLVMKGFFHGSNFFFSQDENVYEPVISEYIHAINDTGSNETSMAMTNESFVIYNGTNGKQLLKGWGWSLQKGSEVYILLKLGIIQPCQKRKGVPFQRLSTIIDKLIELYPIPGVPSDPNVLHLCQGEIKIPGLVDEIMNIEYIHHEGAMDEWKTITQSTNTSQIINNVQSTRPLQAGEKGLFNNPCEKAEVVKDSVPHGSINRHKRSVFM